MLAFFSASAYLNARRAAVTFSLAALLTSASSLGAQERELSKIERGQQLFEHAWKTGSDPQAGADGLGPLYNERSCVACHQLGGVGGAGPNSVNVKLLTVSVGGATRLSIARSGCKGSGTIVLHRFSSGRHAVFPFLDDLVNLGPADKPIPALKPIHMALRRQSPMHAVKQIKGSDDTFEITERNTTPLFGLGLIDAITEEQIGEVAELETKENPAVTGRFVGRFGWRGQIKTLADFVRGACSVELGLDVENPPPLDDVPAARAGQQPDLSVEQSDDLIAFVAHLPRPRRLEPFDAQRATAIDNGEHLFEAVGCAVCHRPKLGPVTGIYSDLLLHDMGQGLSDPAPAQGSKSPVISPVSSAAAAATTPKAKATPIKFTPSGASYIGADHTLLGPLPERMQEWKTPPLWGLRDSGPYLHDGRAKTVAEAIAAHGGEAAGALAKYQALTDGGQKRLLAFLDTLAAPESPEPAAPAQLAAKRR